MRSNCSGRDCLRLTDLFAWLEGQGDKPVNRDPVLFRPVMLAHAIEETDFHNLAPGDFIAEWKWDGIRVQAGRVRMQ